MTHQKIIGIGVAIHHESTRPSRQHRFSWQPTRFSLKVCLRKLFVLVEVKLYLVAALAILILFLGLGTACLLLHGLRRLSLPLPLPLPRLGNTIFFSVQTLFFI